MRLDLEGFSNVSFPRDTITLSTPSAPVDLTGSTAKMQVRTIEGALVSTITGPSVNGIEFVDADAGEIVLHIGWTDMLSGWNAAATRVGCHADLVYDLLVTDADGLTQARLEGRFRIHAGVTIPGGEAFYSPPFGEDAVNYSSLIPTTAYPVVAARTPSNTLIIRALMDGGIIYETGLKDPAGAAGIAGGYQRVSKTAFVGFRAIPCLVQPEDAGLRTTEEAAIRIHDQAYTYSSDGESVNGSFGGFGHGRWINIPANNQIIMGGGPSGNLQPMDAWPAGTIIRGSNIYIDCRYKEVFFGTSTQAVDVRLEYIFNTQSQSTFGTIQAIRSDVRWQDSYLPMPAATRSDQITHAKLAGFPAIRLLGDGVQKGNWNTTTAAPVMQFYGENNPTVIFESSVIYGPPMRKNGVDMNWADNANGRVHLADEPGPSGNPDYAKFRVFINSSTETLPRNSIPMLTTDVFTTLTRDAVVIRPGGAL